MCAATIGVGLGLTRAQVLLLDELTTFLDGADQRGVLEAVRACVGGPGQVAARPVAPPYPCASCWIARASPARRWHARGRR